MSLTFDRSLAKGVPANVYQLVAVSGTLPRLSILRRSVAGNPSGQSPPSILAVSTGLMVLPLGSISRKTSPASSSAPPSKTRSTSTCEPEDVEKVPFLRAQIKYPLSGLLALDPVIVPLSGISGVPSSALILHPLRFIDVPVVLYNSIHSSSLEAIVPDHATSLMIIVCVGNLVAVGVLVIVAVAGVGVDVSAGNKQPPENVTLSTLQVPVVPDGTKYPYSLKAAFGLFSIPEIELKSKEKFVHESTGVKSL
jgi:hypothetical protein